MRLISDKDIEKLSLLTDVAVAEIKKLHTKGVLDNDQVIKVLARNDFKKLTGSGAFSQTQVLIALANEYGMTKAAVLHMITKPDKPVARYACSKCGKRVQEATLIRNDGLCDACVAKSITI